MVLLFQSVLKNSVLLCFFSVLFHFINTIVPPSSFPYCFHQLRFCSFKKYKISAKQNIYINFHSFSVSGFIKFGQNENKNIIVLFIIKTTSWFARCWLKRKAKNIYFLSVGITKFHFTKCSEFIRCGE